MAVPEFQSFMLPLLRFAADDQEHTLAEARDPMVKEFSLTESDLKELLSSGQTTFGNRVAWAKTYLTQAGLLTSTRRGYFRISARGKKVLKNPPSHLDSKFLDQFPEFVQFRTVKKKGPEHVNATEDIESDTPEESLEQAYEQIRKRLSSELIARVKSSSPQFFERLVIQLLRRMEHIDPKVVLIDGKKLSELMIDFDVAVSTVATYPLKRIDSDFFTEE